MIFFGFLLAAPLLSLISAEFNQGAATLIGIFGGIAGGIICGIILARSIGKTDSARIVLCIFTIPLMIIVSVMLCFLGCALVMGRHITGG